MGSARDAVNPYRTTEDTKEGEFSSERENWDTFLHATLPHLKDWVVNDRNAMHRLLQHPFLAVNPNNSSEAELHLRQQRLMRVLAELQPRLSWPGEIEVQVMRELDRSDQLATLQIAAVQQRPDSFMQGRGQIGGYSVHPVGWDLFHDFPPQVAGIPDENGAIVAPNDPGPAPVIAFPVDTPEPPPNEPPQHPSNF